MLFSRKTFLYFIPHQDDELLSMGADICNNVLHHHNVHVILCTDGSKSSVRTALSNGKSCTHHKGTHSYDISTEEFIEARDSEFLDSCRAMGLPKAKIHITGRRGVDGELTVAQAESIIKFYLILYGRSATVCTFSHTNGKNQHADHQTLGKAANNMLQRGVINELRLFVEPYHYDEIADNARMIPVAPTFVRAVNRAHNRISEAVACYSLWAPEKNRFAVGFHSVHKDFSLLLERMTSICYSKKKESSMNLFERLSYRRKKWLKLQNQKQNYYSIETCEPPELDGVRLVSFSAGQMDDYRAFCKEHNEPVRENEVQRLADGSSFWCLVNSEDVVVSTGWLTGKQHFYISETDFGFDTHNSGTGLLYHFVTKEGYRGKGYYGILLRSIVSGAEGYDRFIIYTSPDNSSSANGILKAGFTFDGILCAGDDSLRNYLEQAGFTSVSRKYRMGGLRFVE